MSGFLLSHNKDGMMALTLIILGGLLSIAYGFWAISDVMKRDAGHQQQLLGARVRLPRTVFNSAQ